MEDRSDSFFILFFLMLLGTLVFAGLAWQNFRDNPEPSSATSAAPNISLRCRDGLFFLENGISGKRVPLMDVDAHGLEVQVPCTKAYEAIKLRKAMGRQ